MDAFADGGIGRELGRGNPESGGGKVAFPGDVLDFAPTRDQIAAHVYVVLEGRSPRPEPRPRRLLADASRKGLLTGDGRGEKAHLGFAVGTVVPSGVGEAGPVELCDLLVFACREKALERFRLLLRDQIAPKVGAGDVRVALRPVFGRVERAVCLVLKRLDCVEGGACPTLRYRDSKRL